MSGLLRRIKRTRAADAGQAPPEGRAAAPDGAPPTTELPAAEPASAPPLAAPGPGAASGPAAATTAPAGLEPTDAAVRAAAGRRGRLRRRLRYLRRARELMLRDLGGLLYEIHRTAGGRVDAHATLVGAKVQRIAGLDAEAHALETALGAPSGDALIFQPGVGGTCAACGELHASGARFCSSCGTASGEAAAQPPARDKPEAPAGGDRSRADLAGRDNGRDTAPTQRVLAPGDPLAKEESRP